MKLKISESKRFFKAAAVTLFCASVLFSTAEAQASKRRTRRKVQPPAVIIPLPQQQTEPEIVSRAGEDAYSSGDNQIIVQPNQTIAPETLENKIDKVSSGVRDLKTRVKSLETPKTNDYDEKQKRLMLNLNILTSAETRAESLRKQLFDMIEKQSSVQTRLDQLENDSRPEMIDRSVAFAGSLRPEELRDLRRKNMESEKQNLQNLMTEIQNSRTNLETNVQKADALVEKLRFKLEKDIDDALTDEPKN